MNSYLSMNRSYRTRHPRLLLSAVFKPYGVADGYAEAVGMQMELFNNQITREQGVHSPRHNFWSFPLYFLAENISVPTTVLDFPSWRDFVQELRKGYTHLGFSFIQTNVMKVRRMAQYVRRHYPGIKIILGGYGVSLPDLREIVPCDAVCPGEGVRWLREYFGEDGDRPIRHPIMHGVARKYIYGFRDVTDDSAVLFPGIGCTNACSFCSTSSKFVHRYISYLPTGKSVFDVCHEAESRLGVTGFAIIDENFLTQRDRAVQLLHEMEACQKPYTFAIFSSAENVAHLGVDFLTRLGVVLVWIGAESEKPLFAKQQGIDVRNLIRRLQEHGISVLTSSILFLEHHDRVSLQRDIDWAIGLDSEFHQFMQLTPLPGTPLYEDYLNKGWLLPHFPYAKMSGQYSLMFHHPHFDGKEAEELTRQAFRKKYEVGGPGVIRMARTVLHGYLKMCEDIDRRHTHGISWNPQTLRYDHANGHVRDAFLELRREKMRLTALTFRTILAAGARFAPNTVVRKEIRQLAVDYRRAFGPPSIRDRGRSCGVTIASALERMRMRLRFFSRSDELVRQPPCRRIEYSEANRTVRRQFVDRQNAGQPGKEHLETEASIGCSAPGS